VYERKCDRERNKRSNVDEWLDGWMNKSNKGEGKKDWFLAHLFKCCSNFIDF
jgi:hypothetical protein